jgi:hypothetical protein
MSPVRVVQKAIMDYTMRNTLGPRHRGVVKGKRRGTILVNVQALEAESAFVKKLIISWDFTEHGLSSDDKVHLDRVCQPLRTLVCVGRRMFSTVIDDGLIWEFMFESRCRFKPLTMEPRVFYPDQEDERTCFKCRNLWDYRRSLQGLSTDSDERWV